MAFTLIELLVTISIIAILIGILLPVLGAARRHARIMASPIAYLAADGQVYLTDPEGRGRIRIYDGSDGISVYMRWSPDGRRLAFAAGENKTVVINPWSDEVTTFAVGIYSPAWVSNSTLIGHKYEGGYNDLWELNVDTGRARRRLALRDEGMPYGQFSAHHSPHFTDGFVVAEAEAVSGPMMDVVIRDLSWNRVGVIWQDQGNDIEDYDPRVDWLGERVAWARGRSPGAGRPKSVAVKWLGDDGPPKMLDAGLPHVSFCDWTPDGRLLVNANIDGAYRLAIMKTNGELERVFPEDAVLRTRDNCAAWRRHGAH